MKVEKFLKQIIKTFSEEDFGEGVAEEAQDCLDEIQAIKKEIDRIYEVCDDSLDMTDIGICIGLGRCSQMLDDFNKWKAGK